MSEKMKRKLMKNNISQSKSRTKSLLFSYSVSPFFVEMRSMSKQKLVKIDRKAYSFGNNGKKQDLSLDLVRGRSYSC